MAKTEVISWDAWRKGDLNDDAPQFDYKKLLINAVVGGVTLTLALNFGVTDVLAFTGSEPEAITTMGSAGFGEQLRKATQPIRDIIFSFGHEIYFVMMAWGGIEALIGKTQQGFSRMKASTAAYVVLYWVPWIVQTVNSAVPH